jgi:hypothetical protein
MCKPKTQNGRLSATAYQHRPMHSNSHTCPKPKDASFRGYSAIIPRKAVFRDQRTNIKPVLRFEISLSVLRATSETSELSTRDLRSSEILRSVGW